MFVSRCPLRLSAQPSRARLGAAFARARLAGAGRRGAANPRPARRMSDHELQRHRPFRAGPRRLHRAAARRRPDASAGAGARRSAPGTGMRREREGRRGVMCLAASGKDFPSGRARSPQARHFAKDDASRERAHWRTAMTSHRAVAGVELRARRGAAARRNPDAGRARLSRRSAPAFRRAPAGVAGPPRRAPEAVRRRRDAGFSARDPRDPRRRLEGRADSRPISSTAASRSPARSIAR